MRRLLLAVAVFLTVTATPTFAGYIIIRVLLEGGGSGPGADGIPGGPDGVGTHLGPIPGGRPGSGPLMIPGGMQPTPTTRAAEADYSRSIVVLFPLETDFLSKPLIAKRNFDAANNPNFQHPLFRKFDVPPFGSKQSASLFVDSSSIQLYQELLGVPGAKQSRRTEVNAAYATWVVKKDNPKLLYDAMVFALQSGFVKEALAYAKELLAVATEKKFAIPEGDIKRFVAAWEKMQAAVTGPVPLPSDAETWKIQISYENVRIVSHYAIIYQDNPPEEVDRRATQLNDNFAAFYLWHATRGTVLPVPGAPLVTVLAPQASKMRELHHALDGLPMSDAFYAPGHNLLVLSPERMDEVGQTFLRQNQQVFVKGLNRQQLLNGVIPDLDSTGKQGTPPEDVARATTLAAVEKLAIAEAEIAAVSREGTRQLMYTTGTLPKHVTLPTWLTNGAVNFYTRPRGPAYITVGDDDKPNMHVAISTGYGGPNYVLQRYFRDFGTKKELPSLNPQKPEAYELDSARLLENVLGDVYFNGIKNGDDPDPAPKKAKKIDSGTQPVVPVPGQPMVPGGMVPATNQEDPVAALRKKQQRLAIKANATSWALYYYLTKSKPDHLRQYVAELNKLPRDLPIDGHTAYAVFVRVFKLSATEDGPADPKAMKKFADEWLEYIGTVPLIGHDVPLTIPEPPKTPVEPKLPGGSKDR